MKGSEFIDVVHDVVKKTTFSHLRMPLDILKKNLLVLVLFLAGFMLFTPILTYAYFARDLESKETVMNRNNTGLTLLDRNGEPFFTFYSAKQKTFVPLTDVPKHAQLAIIVAEDKDFYTHPGFSPRSIAAAFVANIKRGGVAYGGSTITQQLVKNSLLKPRKSFFRKYQELVLSFEIERRFQKDEILEMYINSVYFGEGYFGLEEAAQGYFGKKASQLSLSESALLAASIPAPVRFSPRNEEGRQERKQTVLDRLVEEDYVSEEEKEKALTEKTTIKARVETMNSIAPHFAIMVRDELIKEYGSEENISRSGFQVKTTLDTEYQRFAERIVKEQVARLKGNRVTNAAAITLDPKTGEVLNLVGSVDWSNDVFGKFNVATAGRQPGSSFKPIIYATAFENGLITPSTILKDSPTTYKSRGSPDYSPQNYDRAFRGPVIPRRALANSLNVPAVEVMSKVGVTRAIESAKRFGITTLEDPSKYGLSLVLGAGEVKLIELTSAYGVFANKGTLIKPRLILEIRDKHGDLVKETKPDSIKVLDDVYAFLISSILSDNKARAEVFGSALTISRPAAVKTGTTQNYKDAWTVGYTPSLAVGVWVGNNDGTPMDSIAGSLGAAPIWRALMERLLQGKTVEQFEKPDSLVAIPICSGNGLRLRDKNATSSALVEYFIPGKEPKGFCEIVVATPSAEPSTQTQEVKPEEKKQEKKEEKKEEKKD